MNLSNGRKLSFARVTLRNGRVWERKQWNGKVDVAIFICFFLSSLVELFQFDAKWKGWDEKDLYYKELRELLQTTQQEFYFFSPQARLLFFYTPIERRLDILISWYLAFNNMSSRRRKKTRTHTHRIEHVRKAIAHNSELISRFHVRTWYIGYYNVYITWLFHSIF